jgi:hypothetical protein
MTQATRAIGQYIQRTYYRWCDRMDRRSRQEGDYQFKKYSSLLKSLSPTEQTRTRKGLTESFQEEIQSALLRK